MAVRKCYKITLCVINFFLLVACAGLIYFGIRLLREYSNYSNLLPTVYMIGLPCGIILFIGSLLFVVALIGIVTTITEAKCLIATYCTLHLITFVLLMAAIGVLFACKRSVVKDLEKNLTKGLDLYFLDPVVTREIDYMQQSNKCCGVKNYTDWIGTPWYQNQTFTNGSHGYPNSCCHHSDCATHPMNITDDAYGDATEDANQNVFKKGCYSPLHNMFRKEFIISSSVSGSVALILIFAFVAVCGLYSRRPSFEFIGLVEEDAVRV